MVTRDDVARRAGTSSAVVSYVVNNGPRGVSEPARQRVLAAMEELGYRPNALARALRSASNPVLALVVPDIANPFFAELALAIEKAAFEMGYALFLGNAMHDDEQQASYLRAFGEHQVQGMLLIGATQRRGGDLPPATKAALKSLASPLVFLDRLPRGVDGAAVAVDNASGGYQATRHLLEHGHALVGMVTGPPNLSPTRERERGWARALREAGTDPDAMPVLRAEFDRYNAYQTVRPLLASRQSPSALFVQSDEQAIGVLHAAEAAGVKVPQQLAVASFDGIRESALTNPPLTTVQQPVELAGQRAVGLLRDRIDGVNASKVNEMLPVQLMIRVSCGCEDHVRTGPDPTARTAHEQTPEASGNSRRRGTAS